MKKIHALFLLLFFAMGCKTSQPAQKGNFTESDFENNEIEVSLNKTFELNFRANASTGFRWYWANKSEVAIVDSIGEKYIPDQPVLIGSGSTRVWKFKAVKRGTDTLTFNYARSFSDETINTRNVVVKVK